MSINRSIESEQLKVDQVLFLLICGGVLLSPLGTNGLLVFSGSFVAEPFVILFLIFGIVVGLVSFKSIVELTTSSFFLVAIFLCIISALLGWLVQDTPFNEIYAGTRSILIVVIGFELTRLIYKNMGLSHRGDLILAILCFGSLICSLLYFEIFANSSIKRAYSIPCFLLLAVLLMDIGKRSYVYLTVVLIFYMCITSGYRLYILYSLLLIMVVLLWEWQRSRGGAYGMTKVLLAFFLVTIVSVISFGFVVDWISTNDRLYHQVIYKFEHQISSLENNQFSYETDQRLLFYQFYFEDFISFFLPSGFYDRSNEVMSSIWSADYITAVGGSPINDSGFLLLSMTFGWGVTCVAIVISIYKTLVRLQMEILSSKLQVAILLSIVTIMFFSQGSIISNTNNGFYFGCLISVFMFRRRTVSFGDSKI